MGEREGSGIDLLVGKRREEKRRGEKRRQEREKPRTRQPLLSLLMSEISKVIFIPRTFRRQICGRRVGSAVTRHQSEGRAQVFR